MTFLQMITRVSELLEDTAATRWGNNVDPTNAAGVIARHLNDAQRDFARSTQVCKKESAALAGSATTPLYAFYTLPTDFLNLAESGNGGGVWNNGIQLYPVERGCLGDSWATVTGTPCNYLPLEDYGLTELRVYPYPTAVLTALKIFYAYLPADMAANGTVSPIPPMFHMALVWYAVAQALSTMGEYADPAKAQLYMGMYEREVADARNRVARRFSSQGAFVKYRHV